MSVKNPTGIPTILATKISISEPECPNAISIPENLAKINKIMPYPTGIPTNTLARKKIRDIASPRLLKAVRLSIGVFCEYIGSLDFCCNSCKRLLAKTYACSAAF